MLASYLQEFLSIVRRDFTPTAFPIPDKTYDPSYGGGDCSKHGRYYGTCCSCWSEQTQHYKDQCDSFRSQQDRDLENLATRVEGYLKTLDQ